jgi:undecaprenyl pyrophosphate phosphatase UppP
MRRRFYIEGGLAVLAGVLAIVTLFWHDWIETVFRVDSDEGSGAFEWAIVIVLALVAIGLAVAARVEWRRSATT